MNNTIKKQRRDYNLDLIRILASFMVIVIHVSAYLWYSVPSNTFEFNVYNFYDSMARSAVPIFIMISGVFFLNSTKEKDIVTIFKKYILKLVFIFILWSIVYYIYDILINRIDFNFKNLILSIINGPYHFWYIPTIIGLYIISPILIKITQNSSKKIFKYFFGLLIIGCLIKTISYCSFIPYINILNKIFNKLPIALICQYYSYFLLGYFLYNFDISPKKRKIIYIMGILSVITCALLTFLVSQYEKTNIGNFYDNFSIFTFFEACALFLCFKNTYFKSEKIYRKQITTISNCTLGIYIIHILIMNLLFDFNIIQITDFNPILSIPLISILIFVFSLIITYLIKKIKFKEKTIF